MGHATTVPTANAPVSHASVVVNSGPRAFTLSRDCAVCCAPAVPPTNAHPVTTPTTHRDIRMKCSSSVVVVSALSALSASCRHLPHLPPYRLHGTTSFDFNVIS